MLRATERAALQAAATPFDPFAMDDAAEYYSQCMDADGEEGDGAREREGKVPLLLAFIKKAKLLNHHPGMFKGEYGFVFGTYERTKRAQQAIDYADFHPLVIKLFKENPDVLAR